MVNIKRIRKQLIGTCILFTLFFLHILSARFHFNNMVWDKPSVCWRIKKNFYPKWKDFVINAWYYRRMTAHKYKSIWQNSKLLLEKKYLKCTQYILSYFVLFSTKNIFLPNKLCYSTTILLLFLVVVVKHKKQK